MSGFSDVVEEIRSGELLVPPTVWLIILETYDWYRDTRRLAADDYWYKLGKIHRQYVSPVAVVRLVEWSQSAIKLFRDGRRQNLVNLKEKSNVMREK